MIFMYKYYSIIIIIYMIIYDDYERLCLSIYIYTIKYNYVRNIYIYILYDHIWLYNIIYMYIHHISLNTVIYELILLYIVWCLVDIWYYMLVLCPEILSHVKGMVIPITQLGICMVFLCGYETHDCKAIRYVIRWNSTEGNPTLFDAAVSKDVFFFAEWRHPQQHGSLP